MQAARRADIVINNTKDGITPLTTFEEGRELSVYDDDGTELLRGITFSQTINSRGRTQLTVYDENTYLTKNSDTRKFVNVKASDIIRRLCNDFDVPIGNISDTGYVIPKMILREMTIWEMMITALTETRKQTGRRFYVYSEGGRLHVAERKEKVAVLAIERGTNLLYASYYRSIEELRNRVKVYAGSEDGAKSVTVRSQSLIDRYGLMQHVETIEEDATESALRQRANELLEQRGVIDDEAQVEAIGDVNVRAGMAVYVVEPMTGIVGSYYVSTDEHVFENGTHKMYLTLTATDELPTLEYVPPPLPPEVGESNPAETAGDTSAYDIYLRRLGEWNERESSEGGVGIGGQSGGTINRNNA